MLEQKHEKNSRHVINKSDQSTTLSTLARFVQIERDILEGVVFFSSETLTGVGTTR